MAGMIGTFIIWLKRILRSDWLPERARWSRLARSVLPSLVRKKTLSFWQYNKSFIDHASSFKMVDYRPRSFLRFIDLDFVSVYEYAKKKELGQYSAILNEDAWSITHTNKQLNLAYEKKDCLGG